MGFPPYTVRACAFSHQTYPLNTSGFYSVEYEQWFANPTCYNLMRLKNGDLDMKKNPDLVSTLIKIRNEHYFPELIERNRKKLAQHIRNNYYTVVRQVHQRTDNKDHDM
jgi:hypothetical protein